MPSQVPIGNEGFFRRFTFNLDELPEVQVYFHGYKGIIGTAKTFHSHPKCGLPKSRRKGGTPTTARHAVEEGLVPCKRCSPLGNFPFESSEVGIFNHAGCFLTGIEANQYLNDNLNDEILREFSGNWNNKLAEIQLDIQGKPVIESSNEEEPHVEINEMGREQVLTTSSNVAIKILNRIILHQNWPRVITLLRDSHDVKTLSSLASGLRLSTKLFPAESITEEGIKSAAMTLLGDHLQIQAHIEDNVNSIALIPKEETVLYIHCIRQNLSLFGVPSNIDYFYIEFERGDSGLSLTVPIGVEAELI